MERDQWKRLLLVLPPREKKDDVVKGLRAVSWCVRFKKSIYHEDLLCNEEFQTAKNLGFLRNFFYNAFDEDVQVFVLRLDFFYRFTVA